jgi:hypothetical protein
MRKEAVAGVRWVPVRVHESRDVKMTPATIARGNVRPSADPLCDSESNFLGRCRLHVF